MTTQAVLMSLISFPKRYRVPKNVRVSAISPSCLSFLHPWGMRIFRFSGYFYFISKCSLLKYCCWVALVIMTVILKSVQKLGLLAESPLRAGSGELSHPPSRGIQRSLLLLDYGEGWHTLAFSISSFYSPSLRRIFRFSSTLLLSSSDSNSYSVKFLPALFCQYSVFLEILIGSFLS